MLLGLFNCKWAVVMCHRNGVCGVKMILPVVLLFRSKERETLHICSLLCKKFMLLTAKIGSESVRKCVSGVVESLVWVLDEPVNMVSRT